VWLSSPVTELVKTERRFLVNQRPFDGVVLATDVVGTKAVMGQAQGIAERVRAPFEQLRPGQPYAVLRLWVDRDVRTGIPPFVITDRLRVLDAFTTYHRFEREARAWTQNHGGAVLELHCYAVPADLTKDALRQLLIDEMFTFFPELKGCSIKHEAFQVQQNVTAFHVGMYATRPTVDSGVEGLVCAGDWVKLPFPAMLLEAACASGLMAANVLLRQAHLQEEPISSVPPRGLMAGLPQPLARQMLSNRRTSTVSSGTP
jgi:isorenieratene synthase